MAVPPSPAGSGPAAGAADLRIRGPVTRGDLPGLCDRVCGLLAAHGPGTVVCDVTGIAPDAVVVEALARLRLGALRAGCRIAFRGADPGLADLIALMGLDDVLG